MTRPLLIMAFVIGFLVACRDPGISPKPTTPSCESGFILDGAECVPESCGAGRWGNLPVDGATIYVDISAGEGGDGTEAAPYATIQRGLNRAGALGGGLVAVAAGTYPETLEFTTEHADVHLAGRCREMTILDASVGDEATSGIRIDMGYGVAEVSGLTVRDSLYEGLKVASGEVVARDVAIIGSLYWGVEAYHSGSGEVAGLVMEDCLVEGNADAGLFAYGSDAQVTLRETTIKDTNGGSGWGIGVEDGATLSAEGCLIAGNVEVGVAAVGRGVRVTLWETTVRDTQPNADREGGWGIQVSGGATLSAEGCLIEGNSEQGLLVTDAGTEVALRETTVKGTQPNANGELGRGIGVQDGAILSAEGCLVEGNTREGLFVIGQGAQVSLRQTTVKGTQPDATGEYGWGIGVQDGAILSTEGCLIEGNTGLGLAAAGQGVLVFLRETVVQETQPDATGEYGWGIGVQDGATLSAEGCLIDRNTPVGLFASDPGTEVILWETTVSDTRPYWNGEHGRGVQVEGGATLDAERCRIEGNTEVGLMAFDPGTQVSLRESIVRNTLPDVNGELGRGIGVQYGATLSAKGCLIEGNTDMGLLAVSPGSRVTLSDTTVRDTQPDANGERGWGIGVQEGATLHAEGCLIEGNSDIGLFAISPATEVTLRATTVKDTRPGDFDESGWGIGVQDGALLAAEGCLVDGSTDVGLFASDAGTEVTLLDSTIAGTQPGTGMRASAASGVMVQYEAFLHASRLVVESNKGPGLLANADGIVECVGCVIQDNQFAGAVALNGGTLTIGDSTIQGTTANINLLGGAGVYAWPWGGAPPMVTLTNTLIRDNPVAGVWLIGNGSYVLAGNSVAGGVGEAFGSGARCGDALLARDGVEAWDGSSGLLLQDNQFLDASGAGVFLEDSAASFDGNSYLGNSVDLTVQHRSCDVIPEEYSEAPVRDLCPLYDYPTCYAEFFFIAMPAEPVETGEDKAKAAADPVDAPP